ncbi:MAG: hypothetical protein QXJ02_02895 [Candidatus Bathyarchaeia archaeon]
MEELKLSLPPSLKFLAKQSHIMCSGVLSAFRKKGIKAVIDDWLNEKFLGQKVRDSDDRRLTNLMLRLRFFALTSSADDRTLTNVVMKKAFTKSCYQSNALAHTIVPDNIEKFLKQQLRWGRGSFRGMLFALTFFWKRPLKQQLIFYTFVLVNYLSPLIVTLNLFVAPLLGYPDLALIYLAGLCFIHFLHGINIKCLTKNTSFKDVIYSACLAGLAIVLSFVYLFAWFTAWKGKKWMTR